MDLEQIKGNIDILHNTSTPECEKKIDTDVKMLIDEAYLRAKEFIMKNKDKVHKLAGELLEKETLITDDLKNILDS